MQSFENEEEKCAFTLCDVHKLFSTKIKMTDQNKLDQLTNHFNNVSCDQDLSEKTIESDDVSLENKHHILTWQQICSAVYNEKTLHHTNIKLDEDSFHLIYKVDLGHTAITELSVHHNIIRIAYYLMKVTKTKDTATKFYIGFRCHLLDKGIINKECESLLTNTYLSEFVNYIDDVITIEMQNISSI